MFLSRESRRASTERSMRALHSALSRGVLIPDPWVKRYRAPRGIGAMLEARSMAAHARTLRRFGDRGGFMRPALRAVRFLARIAAIDRRPRCSPR